jgi:hypothetical protein
MNPNRIVAVLTPLVFAPLAGAVAAWLAEHFPGVEVDQGALQEIFIAGALIALAPAAQWLHGWQKYEARQAELERDLVLANAAAQPPVAADEAEDEDAEDLSALDELDELAELAELDDFDEELFEEDEPAATGA